MAADSLAVDPRARTQTEHSLLETVLTAQQASTRSALYASLLPPALATISSTGASLNALIKKSPQHQLIPLALATYTELSERGQEFEEWVRVRARRKENEVGDLTHAFRGTCMTSLPGIIEETKVRQALRGLTASRATAHAHVHAACRRSRDRAGVPVRRLGRTRRPPPCSPSRSTCVHPLRRLVLPGRRRYANQCALHHRSSTSCGSSPTISRQPSRSWACSARATGAGRARAAQRTGTRADCCRGT